MTNTSFKRLFYTSLAGTALTFPEGVVIAYSDDGGQTFRGASWVDDAQSCSTPTKTVDTPVIAGHTQAPFGTYVSWDDFNTHTSNIGKLQRVSFNNPAPPATAQLQEGYPAGCIVGATCRAVDIGDGNRQRHRIGVGRLPSGCTSGGEAVFVASTNGFWSQRCQVTSPTRCTAAGQPVWTMTAIDGATGATLASADEATETGPCPGGNAPNCLGDNALIYNSPDPSIAANPSTSDFWIASLTVVNGSNRVHVDGWGLICGGSTPTFTHKNSWTTPDPCPSDLQGCKLPDGGIVLQDEWQPSVGYTRHNGKDTVVVTFYGMREDTNNHFAGVYMSYSENAGKTWTAPARISIPETGTMIPWDPNIPSFQGMTDYNNMGVDAYNATWLPIWGGDNRTIGNATVESELLQ